MNVLVTGANGQLGCELRIVSLASADRYIFTDIRDLAPDQAALLRSLGGETVCTSSERLDITDLDALRRFVARENVDVIVNCAAYTDVEGAEDSPELAELLNAEAPALLAKVMREVGGVLFQISTDYVFGGEPGNTPCREDKKCAPTGAYGMSKLHGEERVKASGCRYVILRTAWMYSEFGRNFLKTMLKLTSEKPSLKVVFDQAGTPTYARDLAELIAWLIAGRSYEGKEGIYNYTGEGVCSWYDFTMLIAELSGHGSCDIRPCHSDEFPSKVRRPAYSVLDKTLIKNTFSVRVPYWVDSVRKCMENMR